LDKIEYAHWLKHARFVARKLAPAHLVDDMAAEAMVRLVKWLQSYDPKRMASLDNYVSQRMRWAIWDMLRAARPGSRADSERGAFFHEVPLDEARDAALSTAVNTDKIDLARAVSALTPKRRAFIGAYLKCGDVALAAKMSGMSTNCGHQHHFHAVRALRKMMC
jgi:RNA polymerase sigma factor (sigma-70 family)